MTLNYDEWQATLLSGAAFLGLALTPSQIRLFYRHMCEMRHWNRRINLTAITDPTEIGVKHFLDAVVPAGRIPDQARILDVGSGAGFPGLPLKVIRPLSQVTLIDSARKRINFLRHVIRQLALENVDAHQARIEDWMSGDAAGAPFDLIVSRAFTSTAELTRVVMPQLRQGATLLLWKGPNIKAELRDLATLAATREGTLNVETIAYRLPEVNAGRNLIAVKMC